MSTNDGQRVTGRVASTVHTSSDDGPVFPAASTAQNSTTLEAPFTVEMLNAADTELVTVDTSAAVPATSRACTLQPNVVSPPALLHVTQTVSFTVGRTMLFQGEHVNDTKGAIVSTDRSNETLDCRTTSLTASLYTASRSPSNSDGDPCTKFTSSALTRYTTLYVPFRLSAKLLDTSTPFTQQHCGEGAKPRSANHADIVTVTTPPTVRRADDGSTLTQRIAGTSRNTTVLCSTNDDDTSATDTLPKM